MRIMNNMRYTTIIFACLLMTLSACYKDNEYWLDENIKEGGTYYPLIQEFNATPVNDSVFTAGGTAELSVIYWSRDEVKELEFYRILNIGDTAQTETLIERVDANPEFEPESEAFIQSIMYSIPDGTSGDTLHLKTIVRTVNDLEREATTDDLKVE